MMGHDLAGKGHWDGRTDRVRPRPPSKLFTINADLIALLESKLTPGSRVLEVGCAPGAFLLWCALEGRADACGVEYAENSYRATVERFAEAGVKADIRHEDFMATTFEPGSFDFVYSLGLVEHFSDPRPMIKKHVEMLKPGGTAIIMVPNFGGGYGWILKRFDREMYDIHNVSIMTEDGMLALAPKLTSARAFAYGRLSLSILFGRPLTLFQKLLAAGVGIAARLQPFKIKPLCPMLILELTRPTTDA